MENFTTSKWKSLACLGLELYEVSEHGEVRRKDKGNILKPDYTIKGYKRVHFWRSATKKHKRFTIHRLVALMWVPNPNIKPYVHHQDENIHNNHRSNLAWVTPSENGLLHKNFQKQFQKQLKDNCPF